MTPASFAPRLTRADGATRHFAVTLEPRHPFLDHHRPGGAALFGTTMSIEVMVAAARAARPDRHVLAIERIAIAAPCVLHGDEPAEIAVRATVTEDDAIVACTVVTEAATGEVLHASGIVRLGARRDGAMPAAAAARRATAAAPAAAVYRLFFHGPAFQVIASAALRDGAMVCGFAHAPASHDGTAMRLHTAPRVIEFCLQTAGLLELARSGRMMIPHRIGAITPLRADAAAADALVATARHRPRRRGERAGIDIAVTAAGVCLLEVAAYATVKLPFPADAEAQAALRRQLCGGGCGGA